MKMAKDFAAAGLPRTEGTVVLWEVVELPLVVRSKVVAVVPCRGMALWGQRAGADERRWGQWGGGVGEWVAAAFAFCALLVGMSAGGAWMDSAVGGEKGRKGMAVQSPE